MQLSNQHDMIKRTLYYWSRLFLDQLPKGKTYRRLLPTITINICDFTLFSKSANYHSTYHLYEDSSLNIGCLALAQFTTIHENAWYGG